MPAEDSEARIIVHVDEDKCEGHARCVAICPELFDLDSDGYARTDVEAVAPEHERAVALAAANCPERAIVISSVSGSGR